jgi:RNA polymerase sigma-70 factor, ECF subfamily
MSPTGDVTRQIFRQMQAGNRDAFDDFFERQTSRILVYINYNMGPRLRRKLEPGDLLQNLYLSLYRNFESFSRRARERGIHKTLVRMADHEITEAYRFHFKVGKRDAHREATAAYRDGEGDNALPVEGVPSPSSSVSQRVMQQEEYQRAMKMLQGLEPLEQYVTVSRIIEGLSAQEIGEKLGKSRGAVQMIIARARDKLRARSGQDPLGPRE